MRKNTAGKWRNFTSSSRNNKMKLKLRSVLKERSKTCSARHKKNTESVSKMRLEA